jgi:hypothetical protein
MHTGRPDKTNPVLKKLRWGLVSGIIAEAALDGETTRFAGWGKSGYREYR